MVKLNKRLELIATIVMAGAAILTAFATLQSSKWHGEQSREYSRANAARIESASFTNRATAAMSIDLDLYLVWLDAIRDELEDGTLVFDAETGYQPVTGSRSTYFYERMRQEMVPILDAWIATDPLGNPNAPTSPFVMEEYTLADAARATELLDEAEAHIDAALEAATNADNYVLVAVVLALAIFFAGISTKLEIDRNRVAMSLLSDAIIVGAVVMLITLPRVPA